MRRELGLVVVSAAGQILPGGVKNCNVLPRIEQSVWQYRAVAAWQDLWAWNATKGCTTCYEGRVRVSPLPERNEGVARMEFRQRTANSAGGTYPSELKDGWARDVSQIGHYGTGDLELTITSMADLEKGFPLIEKSYESA
jgi:hypothetical protein